MFKDKRKNKFAKVLLVDSAFAVLTYFAFFANGGNEQAQNAFQFLVVFVSVLFFLGTLVYISPSVGTINKVKKTSKERYDWQSSYAVLLIVIYSAIMASEGWFILGTVYLITGLVCYSSANSLKESLEKFEQENNQ